MAKRLMCNSCLVFLALVVVAECVPTSVLVNTAKDAKTVKRSSEGSMVTTSKEEGTASQAELASETKMPQKRGVLTQNLPPSPYGYASEFPSVAGAGVWEEEPALGFYQDWDEIYEPANRHGAAYDNLQSLLNSQYYTEPIALPLEYPYKYYGDRKKRSSDKNHPKRRTALRMTPNPTVRVSFWTILVGNTFVQFFHLGLNPTSIQRYVILPQLKDAKICLIAMSVGYVLFNALFLVTGLALYANYEDCDPMKVGVIRKIDQILPHYMAEIGRHFPGLAGFFAAGLFSASLSSMSSCLNTLSGCLYEDFLARTFHHCTELRKSLMLKAIVLILGGIQLVLVFVVDSLGAAVFQLTVSVLSISGGVAVGIFTSGMILPKMNAQGALWGGISAMLAVGGISVGAQMRLKEPPLPLRTDGCTNITALSSGVSFLESVAADGVSSAEDVYWIFRLNYMFYALVGFIVVLAVGYPVSLLTDGGRVEDENLLTNCVRASSIRKPSLSPGKHENVSYVEVSTENK